MKALDRIDRKILDILQSNNQLTYAEIANLAAVSPSSCRRRIEALRRDGAIVADVSVINPEILGPRLEVNAPADRFVVISGCSGGGKSTLLEELRGRGHDVVVEPGRRIVRAEQAGDGAALPWLDMAAFARRAIALALADRAAAAVGQGWVFFDRGLVDAAAALEHAAGEPVLEQLCRAHRYHCRMFMAPPWPEIHKTDSERPHGLATAIAEYERLCAAYALLGYDIMVLPKVSVADRADHILEILNA